MRRPGGSGLTLARVTKHGYDLKLATPRLYVVLVHPKRSNDDLVCALARHVVRPTHVVFTRRCTTLYVQFPVVLGLTFRQNAVIVCLGNRRATRLTFASWVTKKPFLLCYFILKPLSACRTNVLL